MKFETFITEEYIGEPDDKTKTFFKRYGLGKPSPVKKTYYVRVFHDGRFVEEVKFYSAIDAQNYIQKTELFYSHLV
jgi:hypothetical protein